MHYTHYLNLNEDVDNNISRKIRRELKTANEAGLKTRVWNDPETYYHLLSMVYEKQKLAPPLPRGFFERVFKLIQEKDLGYMTLRITSRFVVNLSAYPFAVSIQPHNIIIFITYFFNTKYFLL